MDRLEIIAGLEQLLERCDLRSCRASAPDVVKAAIAELKRPVVGVTTEIPKQCMSAADKE